MCLQPSQVNHLSSVWSILPNVSLQSNWAWKPSNSDCPLSFLWWFSSLLTLYVNYCVWYVYKPLFGSSIAPCRLAYSENLLFWLTKKNRENSEPMNGHCANWQMAWLAQLRVLYYNKTRSFNQWQRVISELYNKIVNNIPLQRLFWRNRLQQAFGTGLSLKKVKEEWE